MKSNPEQLKNRGFVDEEVISQFKDTSIEELWKLLDSKLATERTIAAKLLIKHKDSNTLDRLIKALLKEKKLYTKIAFSETIATFGKSGAKALVPYLGSVGKNQHKELPQKPFKKKNYPLPRDIIARTICKIGNPALDDLRMCLYNGKQDQILEAIDAIGFISYYENENTCFEDIVGLLKKYEDDNLVIWKSIRALQAFPDKRSIEILKTYINSDVEQLRWEAQRSLDQILRNVF